MAARYARLAQRDEKVHIMFKKEGSSPGHIRHHAAFWYHTPAVEVAMSLRRLSSLLLLAPLASMLSAADPPGTCRVVMYADTIENGYAEGAWAVRGQVVNTTVHSGTGALIAAFGDYNATQADKSLTTNLGIVYLFEPYHGLSVKTFQNLEFWVHGGTEGKQRFAIRSAVSGNDWQGHKVLDVTADAAKYLEGGLKEIPAGKWVKVTIPLADLGLAGRDDARGIQFENVGTGKQGVMYLDDISFVGQAPTALNVAVDTAAVVRSVNDHVFGIATYGEPRIDQPVEVAAARDAAYRFQRVFYPTFNMRPGMVPNPHKGLLFAELTGADTMGCVNYADMEADGVKVDGGRSFGTPQEAAAMVAYANAAVDAPNASLALGKDVYGRDWGTVGDWAGIRAGTHDGKIGGRDYSKMRIDHPKPFKVVWWELDNEPWMQARDTDWLDYANFCKQANALMKQVDPTIKTGVTQVGSGGKKPHPEAKNPNKGGWDDTGYYFLAGKDEKASPGRFVPDFIVYHWYGGGDRGASADMLSLLHYDSKCFSWGEVARRLRTQLTDYFGEADGAKPVFIITENNLRATFPLNKQLHSLVSALYLADDLGALLQSKTGDFEGFTWHDWDDGELNKGGYYENPSMYGWRNESGYGVYGYGRNEGARTKYPPHYAFKMLSRYFAFKGDQVVQATTPNPIVRPYAVRQANGNLAVLLINKSLDQDVAVTLDLAGFEPAGPATWYSYGKIEDRNEADITVKPATWKKGAPITIPAYSLNVLVLTAAGTAAPAAPSTVVALPGNAGATITWTAMSRAASYDVLRSTAGGKPEVVAKAVTASTYTDKGLTNGTAYTWQVQARNAAGVSTPSEAAVATPVAPPAAAVTALVATPADQQVTLTWEAVTGATDYLVERAEKAAGPWTELTRHPYYRTVEQQLVFTRYNDRKLAAGKSFVYRVSPLNAGGVGPAATVNATAGALRTGPWSNVDLTNRDDGASRIAADGTVVVEGSGMAWYNNGEGRFVYQRLSGDGSITARVAAVEGKGQYGKNIAGVMIRDLLEKRTDAKWMMLGITPNSADFGAACIISGSDGGNFESEKGVAAGQRHHAPSWVRITRAGDVLTAFLSTDGKAWTEYRRETLSGLPADVFVGLVVNSMAYYAPATGRFDQISVEGKLAP
jgi:hypothetical protein